MSVHLEPAARDFAQATALPPYLFDLGPVRGRAIVDEVQSGPAAGPAAEITEVSLDGGPSAAVPMRIVRPLHTRGTLPVIVYMHGAGWVFGNSHTHDRLVRELAAGVRAAVVFPGYSLSPEAISEVSHRDRGGLRGRHVGCYVRRRSRTGPGADGRGRR
ncbi:MAG TPA: alpha/beta hydrolase [Streptosporangiaceae bacterium]|jgi:acetyl esterase|nr:alpha/beta hydrolase [Streptosporangiaceae bacterium]